ncbi:DUF6252 family protein [Mesonia maritima]|uniref:DUF4352 domain-containing protein n=1 Tax=Mesonia maritima TaxID=1793873 RepID=A0ABU1K8A2_9FLAO|nr:DUF6252 family protein [Mesonia maritima]MDR6301850.1 hypothetical protein [Mesonia maritima]
MRKLMYLFLGLSLITSISCSKDDDGGSSNNASNGIVKAKIDGASFSSSAQGTQASRVDNNGGITIAIVANDLNSGKNITLNINSIDGEGTYDIGGDNLVFIVASYTEGNASDPLNSQSWTAPYDEGGVAGEIKISELTDSKIKGTFSFKGKNPNDDTFKELTEGSFNLDITQF